MIALLLTRSPFATRVSIRYYNCTFVATVRTDDNSNNKRHNKNKNNSNMVKAAKVVNLQKVTTFFWILALMAYYNNWGPTSYVYLALHGTYGFCWMIKEAAFPNSGLTGELSWPEAIVASLVLFLPGYWSIPILAISQPQEASPILLGVATMMYIIGIVVMMVSDCQTYWILKLRPGRLITEGMNRYTRHPNYLGEVFLYSSFALLARHWMAFLIFGIAWLILLLPSNLKKEESLRLYPAWKQYHSQSGFYLPFIPAVVSGKSLDAHLLSLPKESKKVE